MGLKKGEYVKCPFFNLLRSGLDYAGKVLLITLSAADADTS
jgi:hypothetical protein